MIRELQFGRRAALSGKPKSMVVFVHGYGANGEDLLGLADPLGEQLPGTVFVAPDAPDSIPGSIPGASFGFQWFPIPRFDGSTEAQATAGLAASAADLNAFLDARLAEERLTAEDLALVGFSQGAMISLHIAPRRMTPVAGVVAISGRLIAPELLAAETRVKPPVLLVHGDADPVVPFEEMARAGNALTAAGFDTYGHVMPGTGHGIAPDGLSAALRFLKKRLPG